MIDLTKEARAFGPRPFFLSKQQKKPIALSRSPGITGSAGGASRSDLVAAEVIPR